MRWNSGLLCVLTAMCLIQACGEAPLDPGAAGGPEFQAEQKTPTPLPGPCGADFIRVIANGNAGAAELDAWTTEALVNLELKINGNSVAFLPGPIPPNQVLIIPFDQNLFRRPSWNWNATGKNSMTLIATGAAGACSRQVDVFVRSVQARASEFCWFISGGIFTSAWVNVEALFWKVVYPFHTIGSTAFTDATPAASLRDCPANYVYMTNIEAGYHATLSMRYNNQSQFSSMPFPTCATLSQGGGFDAHFARDPDYRSWFYPDGSRKAFFRVVMQDPSTAAAICDIALPLKGAKKPIKVPISTAQPK